MYYIGKSISDKHLEKVQRKKLFSNILKNIDSATIIYFCQICTNGTTLDYILNYFMDITSFANYEYY